MFDKHAMSALYQIVQRPPPTLSKPESFARDFISRFSILRLTINNSYSSEFSMFLARCLRKDPAERASADLLLSVRFDAFVGFICKTSFYSRTRLSLKTTTMVSSLNLCYGQRAPKSKQSITLQSARSSSKPRPWSALKGVFVWTESHSFSHYQFISAVMEASSATPSLATITESSAGGDDESTPPPPPPELLDVLQTPFRREPSDNVDDLDLSVCEIALNRAFYIYFYKTRWCPCQSLLQQLLSVLSFSLKFARM